MTSAPRRILIRGVNWLGDAVMTLPALTRLRERFPEATLTLLAPEKLATLWDHQPGVDRVLGFSRGAGLWQVSRTIRSGAHDLGIALPNSHRSALELWLARVPRRVGLAGPGRSWLFTTVVQPRPGTVRMRKRTPAEVRRRWALPALPEAAPAREAHQVHDYLHLMAALGADRTPVAPRIEVTPRERSLVREKFGLTAGQRWLGLNPGAEYGPAKRWPPERFALVAREILAASSSRWILLGGKAEVALAGELESRIEAGRGERLGPPRVVNLAGRTNLRELCGVLDCCGCLLTNDTGPMHVAAALGVPVVAPFGSTSPELTGPGLPGDPRHRLLRHAVPCAPCFLRECPLALQCLEGISVEQVVAAVREVGGFSAQAGRGG